MALDPGRPARIATFVLMTLAYAACEVAAAPDGRPSVYGILFGLGLLGLTVAGSYRFRPAAGGGPSRKVSLLLLAAFALPVAIDPVLREHAGYGLPYELQLMNGLRNLGLGLCAAATGPTCRRLAAVVALFLALFAAAMGDQPAVPYLLVALAVAGGVWLVLNHIADRPTATGEAGTVIERVRLRVPVRETIVFAALVAVALAVTVFGPTKLVATLGEWFPSSGGTGEQDPFARSGVNDGPEEVRGEGTSVGMTESDSFIESDKDSLLDVVTDMYGPPHKPPKNLQRTVAVGLEKVRENHSKLSENKRPNREFDTSRAGPKDPRKGASRGARGLFEVEGRTPLHIAAVAYDRYDVSEHRWLQAPTPTIRRIDADPAGDDWMVPQFRRATGDWYAEDDRHQLKAADLRDRLLPTPALTRRFRIKRVSQPEAYEWDYDGVLGLAGRTRIPAGLVVHTDCRTLDPTDLPDNAFAAGGFSPAYVEVPPELAGTIRPIALAWAGDIPRGWPQVEAVLRRLREEYALDRSAAAPAGHPAPVLWFLTESRRGPDYLFATAAGLLLRSLGYPTRVCLGYYAGPDAYDAASGHTPVKDSDLHMWPELLLRDGYWLVVEPTPGYAVLPAKWPWYRRAWSAMAGWAGRHWLRLIVAGVILLLLVWRRNAVRDLASTAVWRITSGRGWRRAALRTIRLLELRGRLAGRGRSPTQTLAEWAAGAEGLGELIRIAEHAVYAPALPPPAAEADVLRTCNRAVVEWSRRRFRQLATPGTA